jgi:hypothetical protein
MKTRGRLSIDPGTLASDGCAGKMEIVVPFTEPDLTKAVLDRAVALGAGLNLRVFLLAVHTVPYPAQFGCPSSVHSFLVEQLVELCSRCPIPVDAQVVLARTRDDGFRHALKPESTILIGTRKRFWRTSQELLARRLAADGHNVALLHIG